MNLKTKLTLMSLLMAFGILQTQLLYAGHESYWDGQAGTALLDVTGSCSGSASASLASWPNGVPNPATWTGPLSGAGSNSTIVKSIEIPDGKILVIKGSYELYTGPNTTSPFVKFLVRKGGTLIIDGGTLTRCSDDILINQGMSWSTVLFPNAIGSPSSSAGNEFTSLTNPAHINLNFDNGMGNVLDYYTSSMGYPFEPVHQNFVNDILGSVNSCVFNDYCLPNSENPNEYYTQKKGDEIREQYDNLYAIQRSIAKFELDSYTYYMNRFDTTVATYFKHHWISFNNHRRVMTEGKHNLDMNEAEVAYLDDVVKNQIKTNASWQWCRGMLNAYNRYIETTSIPVEAIKNQEFKLYPNPASRILSVRTEESFEGQIVRIYNTLGQEVLRTSINNNKINIESLQNGSYIIKLESKQGTYVQKFMVEK